MGEPSNSITPSISNLDSRGKHMVWKTSISWKKKVACSNGDHVEGPQPH